MRMPGADHAIVDPFKLQHYLLSPQHARGQHKARFFAALGYTRTNWSAFAALLREHATSDRATQIDTTIFGTRYVIAEPLTDTRGRSAILVSVWIIRHNEPYPRLITAHKGRIR